MHSWIALALQLMLQRTALCEKCKLPIAHLYNADIAHISYQEPTNGSGCRGNYGPWEVRTRYRLDVSSRAVPRGTVSTTGLCLALSCTGSVSPRTGATTTRLVGMGIFGEWKTITKHLNLSLSSGRGRCVRISALRTTLQRILEVYWCR